MKDKAWVVGTTRKGNELPSINKVIDVDGLVQIPDEAFINLQAIRDEYMSADPKSWAVYEVEINVVRKIESLEEVDAPIVLQLVDFNKSDYYMNQARNWAANSPSAGMFNDCRSSARMAIAEFLANQDGYTLYENASGKVMS